MELLGFGAPAPHRQLLPHVLLENGCSVELRLGSHSRAHLQLNPKLRRLLPPPRSSPIHPRTQAPAPALVSGGLAAQRRLLFIAHAHPKLSQECRGRRPRHSLYSSYQKVAVMGGHSARVPAPNSDHASHSKQHRHFDPLYFLQI